jgi:RHS repeat-associated protein
MRAFQTIVYDVNQTTGVASGTGLTTNNYYNHRGQLIEQSQPGGLVMKYKYNGAGWQTEAYATDGAGGASWAAASSESGDNVIEQTDTVYDPDGNPILVSERQRFDSDIGMGVLGTPTVAPFARVYYTAYYYDASNRPTATVNVGTNAGTAYTRPASVPARSSTVLVTSYGYTADSVQQVSITGSPTGGTFTLAFNGQTTAAIAYNATAATVQSAIQALSSIGSGNALVAGGSGGPWQIRFAGTLAGAAQPAITANGSGLTGGMSPAVAVNETSLGGDAGRQQQVTDPKGLVTRTDYDWLGQPLRTIEDFVNFAPSASSDLTTQWTYDGDGNRLTSTAMLPGGVVETTRYVYGASTTSMSNPSTINSNDLLSEIDYPDPGTGLPSSTLIEKYGVDALGEVISYTDRNMTSHAYTYNVLGRLTLDSVTQLGANVDGSVQSIQTSYNALGDVYQATSYASNNATGTPVNQVQDVYNGLNQLVQEYQSVSGAVNTSSTPSVQYAYNELAGGANNSRLKSMTYPNGRVLTYGYNSGIDSSISRLSSISDSGGVLESYKYLGLNTVVERDRPQINVNLTYISPTGSPGPVGDKYIGLDLFGRVVDQNWYNPTTATSTDRFQYGYDQDGNVLYRNNTVNTAFGELYHASGAGNGYNGLGQMTDFARGVLSASGSTLDTITSPSFTQDWTLDPLGNWASVKTNSTTQTRTTNLENEVTSAGGTLTFDANGNTTTDDKGHACTYDAWNHLISVKNGGTTLAAYSYDAFGRRVTRMVSGTTTAFYYSAQWQDIEERVGSTPQAQYVFSPIDINAFVERDSSSGLSLRLWVQQDANGNVTALVNNLGNVVERYIYSPYGAVTYLNASWGTISTSAYASLYLFQGNRLDLQTGLYNARNRDYSASLGRWLQQDPAGYVDGLNRYGFVGDAPATFGDPLGLDWLSNKISEFLFGTSDPVMLNAKVYAGGIAGVPTPTGFLDAAAPVAGVVRMAVTSDSAAGMVQAAGGVGEAMMGATMVPGTGGVSTIMIVHGLDNAYTGTRRMFSNQPHSTITAQTLGETTDQQLNAIALITALGLAAGAKLSPRTFELSPQDQEFVDALVRDIVGSDPAPNGLSAADSWGRPETLADHFARHGADFGATSAEDYAQQASLFLQDSQARGLPTKIDSKGIIRIYDPETNSFGVYNANGKTASFYKPNPAEHGCPTNLDYWNKQKGNAPWTPSN